MPAIIFSDNGVSSGSAGLKTSGSNDGILTFQTTTAGGTATTAVTINTSQNVGIGTGSPTSKLQVVGSVLATGAASALRVNEDGAGTKVISIRSDFAGVGPTINVQTADPLIFNTNNTERARIDSSGRLLVGSTSSIGSCNAQFNDSGGQSALFNSSSASGSYVGWYNSGSARGFIGAAAQLVGGGSASNLAVRAEGDLIFATSSFERARINADGFFLVGTTTPSASLASRRTTGGAALYAGQIVATNDTTALIEQTGVGGNGSQNIGLVVRIQAWNNADRILTCQFTNSGSPQDRMYVQRDGSSYNTTGVWGTISDARVKQDITDASPQWEDFKKIKFRKFRMIDDVEAMADAAPYLMGPVAQELEEAGMNGLVETPTRQDGTELNKQVKLSIMYMKGMKALQEALLRIEQLEADVATLKGTP
jgi:hypothetical protein